MMLKKSNRMGFMPLCLAVTTCMIAPDAHAQRAQNPSLQKAVEGQAAKATTERQAVTTPTQPKSQAYFARIGVLGNTYKCVEVGASFDAYNPRDLHIATCSHSERQIFYFDAASENNGVMFFNIANTPSKTCINHAAPTNQRTAVGQGEVYNFACKGIFPELWTLGTTTTPFGASALLISNVGTSTEPRNYCLTVDLEGATIPYPKDGTKLVTRPCDEKNPGATFIIIDGR